MLVDDLFALDDDGRIDWAARVVDCYVEEQRAADASLDRLDLAALCVLGAGGAFKRLNQARHARGLSDGAGLISLMRKDPTPEVVETVARIAAWVQMMHRAAITERGVEPWGDGDVAAYVAWLEGNAEWDWLDAFATSVGLAFQAKAELLCPELEEPCDTTAAPRDAQGERDEDPLAEDAS